MKILVACEESQAVTKELRRLGHEAYSCDILPCSGSHPEWHLQQDVTPLLQQKWDMIIAFPPCTHLAISGARHFKQKRKDGRQQAAIEFFGMFLMADCPKIAIENPIGIISGEYISYHFPELSAKYSMPRKPTQIIQPWMFGDKASKATCLWIKGLPKLIPFEKNKPDFEYWVSPDGTRRMEKWMYENRCITSKGGKRAMLASKTFPGIAKAMAEQWGGKCENKIEEAQK